ncbi:MAG: hypothetical protein KatS3mg103_0568 [Phycisphaerales bacterium]|nr:MAG: hypothetical protein KatS3mg103_0568 [Phycisphaerales bacterium]
MRLPAKPARGLRVLSYNVEHTSPAKNPAPFARVLSVLQPDVMLFQEWVEGDDQALRAWLTAHVDDQTTWHVLKGQAWGVAIASRYPLTPATAVDAPNPVNPQQPLRFLSAFVQTPAGPVLVGTTHLKCCGTKDSREDRQRLTEATTIADMVAKALDAPPQPDDAPAAQPWAVVLGGDMNLVGSRPPLEALAHGTDLDGSDLAVAPAQHLGDPVHYTWFDPGNAFTPGRLDYLLYSDASATAVHAFVLDTTKLGEAALARLGLDPTDTAASDHLPLVLDLVPTPAEGSTPAAR